MDLLKSGELPSDFVPQAPSHPFMIMIGGSVAAAHTYVVTVEKLVAYRTKSLYAAVSYIFASYYVFNMEYPKELSATLEFMQRFFAKIESEGAKSKKKKRFDIHPKVLRLASLMRRSDTNTA